MKHLFSIPRLLVVSFLLMIGIGTVMLKLPFMISADDSPVTWMDAGFTATSAVCVTGLVVRETGDAFSFAGQLMILLMIQAGGLGILTFSNFVILGIRSHSILPAKMVIEEHTSFLPSTTPKKVLRRMLFFTFISESVGAVVLTSCFLREYDLGQAAWLGIFHSISAFCNAGFVLFEGSFVRYSNDVVINITMMALIFLGSLGFLAASDIWETILKRKRGNRTRMSLHSRTVLYTSFFLIFAGAIIFLMIERFTGAMPDNAFKAILPSFFQSVTARTAGFHTIEIAQMSNVALMVLIVLMFIGGSPGSTGGGVRTTTAAVLYAMIRSRARGRHEVELLERTVPRETVTKALVTTAGMILAIFTAMFMLQMTEVGALGHEETRGQFLNYLFEVVSALCTVGLSTGVTDTLSSAGRIIIMICMFVGRLGPIIIAVSIRPHHKTIEYSYPEEKLLVG